MELRYIKKKRKFKKNNLFYVKTKDNMNNNSVEVIIGYLRQNIKSFKYGSIP